MIIDDEVILNAFKPYTPRPIQIDALWKILRALKNNQIPVIEAPAGSGKSIIAYAMTNLLKTAWIVTPRTALQRQYHRDFSQFPVGMGKSHYPYTVQHDGAYEDDPKIRGFDHLTELADKLYEVMQRPVYGLQEFKLKVPPYEEVLEQVKWSLDTEVDTDKAAIADLKRKIADTKEEDKKEEYRDQIKSHKQNMRGKQAKWISLNQKYARYKSTSPAYLRNLYRENYDPYYKDVYGSTFFNPVAIVNHGILAEYVCKRTHMRTHDKKVDDVATGDNVFYRRMITVIDEAHLLRKMGQWIGDLAVNQYQLACLFGKELAPKVKDYYGSFRENRDTRGNHKATCAIAQQLKMDLCYEDGACTALDKKLVRLFSVLTDPTAELSPTARDKLKFQLDQLLQLKETLDHLYFLDWSEYTLQIKGGELKFKIQDVSPILDHYLYSTGHFLLFMSATIGDKDVFLENIPVEDRERVVIFRLDDTFNYDRSPIECKNVYDKDQEDLDLKYGPVSAEIQEILDKHPNERGIISCTSFEQVKEITKRVNSDRFIKHAGSGKLPEHLAKYLETDNGVLISPSIKEGLDLKNDQCRFIIVPKLPWDPLNEPADRWYYMKKKRVFYNAMIVTLVQMVGRGVRNENDWSKIYILDKKSHYWMNRLSENQLLKRLAPRFRFV